MAEQKTNEAAAAGYRVIAFVPASTSAGNTGRMQTENSPEPETSGFLVLLQKRDHGAPYEYRILANEDRKQFEQALNYAASAGFRVLPSSYRMGWVEMRGSEQILWPTNESRRSHFRYGTNIVLLEKAPGNTASYEYRVENNKKNIDKVTAQGFSLIAGTATFSNFLFEKSSRQQENPSPVRYSRIATFKVGDEPYDINLDVAANKVSPRTNPKTKVAIQPQSDDESNAVEPGTDNNEIVSDLPKIETDQLAGTGLRYLAPGLSKFMWTPIVDFVSEVTNRPPTIYHLIVTSDLKKLESSLNAFGAKGYALFPQLVLVKTSKVKASGHRAIGFIPVLEVQVSLRLVGALAIMTPAPDTSTNSYRLLELEGAADLLGKLNQAASDGFHFVTLSDEVAVVEKTVPAAKEGAN